MNRQVNHLFIVLLVCSSFLFSLGQIKEPIEQPLTTVRKATKYLSTSRKRRRKSIRTCKNFVLRRSSKMIPSFPCLGHTYLNIHVWEIQDGSSHDSVIEFTVTFTFAFRIASIKKMLAFVPLQTVVFCAHKSL